MMFGKRPVGPDPQIVLAAEALYTASQRMMELTELLSEMMRQEHDATMRAIHWKDAKR